MKKTVALLLVFVMYCVLCSCKLFHQHIWKHATCTEPKTCIGCGETEGNALGHIWAEATCTEPRTCLVCGATEGEALGHILVEATCTEPKTCPVCGATEGEALGHTWVEATCIMPKTCSVCGATVGEALDHTWIEATCIEPTTCSVCGITEGNALGHTWVVATCTKPKTCSVCGTTEGQSIGHTWKNATCTNPKTCIVCGITEGNALGHTWVAATCIKPKTCSICGATEGNILGHKLDDFGFCLRCGQDRRKWVKDYYVDEFKQNTNIWYISNKYYIRGSFSNSATTNSELHVEVLVDIENISFMLYEYGRNLVKNSSNRYNDKYNITMKDGTGQKTSLTGTMYCGTDRLFIDDRYISTVLQALKESKSVSFYIVNSDRTTTTYLFTVDCLNFIDVYKKASK